jgi:hypothetical protein
MTVEALDDPRGSFATHAFDTPWTRIQLAYFVGTAMWTYLTQPFCLTLPGFRVEELSPRREDGKALRRLRVDWPEYLASHSSRQTLYFDDTGRLARHDYQVEIVAGASAGHLFDGFVSVDGLTLPTRHRIHPRDAADRIDTSNIIIIVAIDIDDIAFGQLGSEQWRSACARGRRLDVRAPANRVHRVAARTRCDRGGGSNGSRKGERDLQRPGTQGKHALDLFVKRFRGAGGATARIVFAAPAGRTLTSRRRRSLVAPTVALAEPVPQSLHEPGSQVRRCDAATVRCRTPGAR